MSYQITIFSILIAAIAIQAKQLDPGPQTFSNSNSSSAGPPQNQQKRFATKDVLVYLTPSQIKDLHAGKIELQSQPSGEITISQAPNLQQLPYKNPQSSQDSHHENLNILKAPLIQEHQLDNKQQEQHGVNFFNAPNELLINHAEAPPKFFFFTPEEPKAENPKFQSSVQYQENNKNEWTPIKPTEKNLEDQSQQQQYQKQWQNSFENNYEQAKASNIPDNYKVEEHQPFAHNYNPLIYALAHENAAREQKNQIEKQKALAQAESIANSPPVIIHREVKITKHQPVPVVKHVKVPVPTPVLVPVLHPYEVKVPQPYPVPVEVIKHIPVPVIRSEKAEAEKAVPYEVNQHPGKNVYIRVDSPQHLHLWKN